MEKTFKAPNGETLIARDEIQASAFLASGLEEVIEKPAKKSKAESAE